MNGAGGQSQEIALSPNARTWLNRIGGLLGLAGIVFVGIRLHGYAGEINFQRIGVGGYIATTALAGMYAVLNLLMAFGWQRLLRHLDVTVSRPWAIYAYAISQLAKYVPGNIFQFAGRQAIGLAAGIGNGPLAKSTVYELAIQAAAGILFTPLVVPFVAAGVPGWLGWVSFAAVLAVALWLAARTGGADFAAAVAFYLTFIALAGLVFVAAFVLAGGSGDLMLYPAIAGAYVIAWLVGLITPGAPAGLGVREAVLLFMLGGISSGPVILLAVVIGRTVTVLGDLLFFTGGQIVGRFYGMNYGQD
ncbi:hypothetical protein MesoLj113c_56020 [Mesorhizobium sp. 113-3-9]|uniref:hypothetical protein n=1 Tax=Mesorhizobium sp. 113-3-9 TaxID=2744517 RepID=UPI001938BD27|nr:hypothetical protein [Mesorhizobium sp. 113-3-9]BCG89492.1 hypothetical protein MesoLj113c_56020 [Mesorhizobium sp. 113-3-9]